MRWVRRRLRAVGGSLRIFWFGAVGHFGAVVSVISTVAQRGPAFITQYCGASKVYRTSRSKFTSSKSSARGAVAEFMRACTAIFSGTALLDYIQRHEQVWLCDRAAIAHHWAAQHAATGVLPPQA